MRPTIEEQLRGNCRLLEQLVAPALQDEHATRVLSEVIKNLQMLETAWMRVLPFLNWDNTLTADLLESAKPVVSDDIAARIDDLPTGPVDTLDVTAVMEHNDRLRGVLSEIVTTLDPTAGADATTVHRNIVEHLDLRARRYPMRMVPELSPSSSGKDS